MGRGLTSQVLFEVLRVIPSNTHSIRQRFHARFGKFGAAWDYLGHHGISGCLQIHIWGCWDSQSHALWCSEGYLVPVIQIRPNTYYVIHFYFNQNKELLLFSSNLGVTTRWLLLVWYLEVMPIDSLWTILAWNKQDPVHAE